MDKSRDARRVANRFSKKHHSINNKNSGFGAGFFGKSKKGKFKKLGFVGEVSSSHEEHEMACDVSASSCRENEISLQSQSFMNTGSAKRFKIPKRDCNGADHVSVPRKLRSAMKKRNLESVSRPLPASKKLNHSLKEDGMKRERQEMEAKSDSGSITKDEEEVVETLYALASLFPDSDTLRKTHKLVNASSLQANTLFLPVEKGTQADTIKATKDYVSLVSENVPSPLEPIVQEQVVVPALAKTEKIDENSFCKPENINVPPEQYPNSGLKQVSANEVELPQIKPEIAFGAKVAETQVAQQEIVGEYKKNGLALWPGLCSTVSSDPGNLDLPAWMGAALCPSKSRSLEADHSPIKISKATNGKNLMKRCTSHVYIASLIRVLQGTESKNRNQYERSEHRVPNLMGVNGLSQVRHGLSSIIFGGSTVNSSAVRNQNPYEIKNCLSNHEKLQQDNSPVALAYGIMASQNQSFDFLSLSPGDGNASTSEARKGLPSPSHNQFPYLHSLPQHRHHQAKTFPVPQTCHISSAYNNNQLSGPVSAHQAHLQFLPYPTSPFSANTHTSSSLAFAKQQQQQQFWAAQYSSNTGNSNPLSQISSSQNLMQDRLYCSRHIPVNSQPQQLQLMTVTSPLTKPTRAIRQDYHLPMVLEENGGGFRANSAPTLQLLCNEHR